MKKTLTGAIVRITSDNENYTEWLEKEFIITASYYQDDRDEQPIYDLEEVLTGFEFPYSLYESEFEVL